jgi:mannitol/fructose-specific phosphotransferase system IIA component (Ntr-type)
MDLLTLLREQYVQVGLRAPKKEAAIEQLLDFLLAQGALPGGVRGDLLSAVLERERRLSTGLECGIAIPHGTTTHTDLEVAALGIYPDGVPFESVDNSMTRIVILLITPLHNRHRHVINLAGIARQLLCSDLRGDILNAGSPQDVLTALRRRSGPGEPGA